MEKVSTTLLSRFWLDPTVSSFVASLRTGGAKLTTKCQEAPRNQTELQMPFLVDVPQEFIC